MTFFFLKMFLVIIILNKGQFNLLSYIYIYNWYVHNMCTKNERHLCSLNDACNIFWWSNNILVKYKGQYQLIKNNSNSLWTIIP